MQRKNKKRVKLMCESEFCFAFWKVLWFLYAYLTHERRWHQYSAAVAPALSIIGVFLVWGELWETAFIKGDLWKKKKKKSVLVSI